MAPTIYVLTFYGFNHNSPGFRNKALDPRFLNSDRHFAYYLFDDQVPEPLRDRSVVLEKEIDPALHEAGKRHFAEWSFLLAEAKHGFAEYPLFMISSRFYDKNRFLRRDLSAEWDSIFAYLEQYGWGYLPSYDRALQWVDMDRRNLQRVHREYRFFPFSDLTFSLIEELYGVRIPDEYSAMSDFHCNYIGFQSRQHLLDYIGFYMPLINTFFDDDYQPKRDLSPYVLTTGGFKNEKPFTHYLELMSHLFFFKESRRFFGLHYDGYYEVDERHRAMRQLARIDLPWEQRVKWSLGWNGWWLKKWLYPLYDSLPDPAKGAYRQAKATLRATRTKALPRRM